MLQVPTDILYYWAICCGWQRESLLVLLVLLWFLLSIFQIAGCDFSQQPLPCRTQVVMSLFAGCHPFQCLMLSPVFACSRWGYFLRRVMRNMSGKKAGFAGFLTCSGFWILIFEVWLSYRLLGSYLNTNSSLHLKLLILAVPRRSQKLSVYWLTVWLAPAIQQCVATL